MRTIVTYILILLATACVSCGGGRKKTEQAERREVDIKVPVHKNELVTIDIAADYPEQQITLQDVAEVKYIPLAMSKDVLLKDSDNIFYLSDNYIMILSDGGTICVFNRAGEILSHFNRRGRGPNEYLRILGVAFDETAEEIFIVSGMPPNGGVFVYTLDGEHKRTLPLHREWLIEGAWDFDDNLLLVYDGNNVYHSISYDNRTNGKFSTTPYHLISKLDGSIVETLPLELAKRYSGKFHIVTKTPTGENTQEFQLGFGANKHYGGKDFTLVDMSSDTVYLYSRERILTPVLVRTPSVHAAERRMVWLANLITADFIVFSIPTLDFDGAMKKGAYPLRELMYNFRTRQICEPEFINDNTSKRWNTGLSDTKMPTGITVDMLDPLRLVEAREKGDLSGPLAEVAAGLAEDDKPVVMIVKFK